MRNFRNILRITAIPIAFLVISWLFMALYDVFNLPSSDELIDLAKTYYLRYGYLIIFLAAVAEGFLAINWYLPGSFVIVLGVSFSQDNPINAAVLVGIVILGFFFTYIADYVIGRYAWYRFLLFLGLESPLERIKRRVEKYGLAVIFSTYFHPNLGALTATSAGILRLPFSKFISFSALAVFAWNMLWGTLVYFIGPFIIDMLELLGIWLAIPGLMLWIIFVIARYYFQQRRRCNRSGEAIGGNL